MSKTVLAKVLDQAIEAKISSLQLCASRLAGQDTKPFCAWERRFEPYLVRHLLLIPLRLYDILFNLRSISCGCSSVAEPSDVTRVVEGSIPSSHPNLV